MSAMRRVGRSPKRCAARPYQIVLFDEIEKAHGDVFNVLLQVLDDGRLTDGQGRTVDFRNTLIVLTSNLGAEILVNQPDGEPVDAVREQVMNVVRASFRPEFLNRLDEILLFQRLERGQIDQIVDLQIGRLQALLEDRKITIELDDAARTWLADKGYDPTYGARPLKRVIQKALQDPLADQILAGDVGDGDTVKVFGRGRQTGAETGTRSSRRRNPRRLAVCFRLLNVTVRGGAGMHHADRACLWSVRRPFRRTRHKRFRGGAGTGRRVRTPCSYERCGCEVHPVRHAFQRGVLELKNRTVRRRQVAAQDPGRRDPRSMPLDAVFEGPERLVRVLTCLVKGACLGLIQS